MKKYAIITMDVEDWYHTYFPEADVDRSIVKIICKELEKPESLITHVEDRKGHDMRYGRDDFPCAGMVCGY